MIQNLQVISIHGQKYYDIVYTEPDKAQTMKRSRAPYEEVYPNPQPGDHIQIHMIMATITKIDLIE